MSIGTLIRVRWPVVVAVTLAWSVPLAVTPEPAGTRRLVDVHFHT